MGIYDDSRGALERFDGQLRTSEKLGRAGAGFMLGGVGVALGGLTWMVATLDEKPTGPKVMLGTGIVMMPIGYLLAEIGEDVARKAFVHLDDAIDYFNAHYSRQSPSR